MSDNAPQVASAGVSNSESITVSFYRGSSLVCDKPGKNKDVIEKITSKLSELLRVKNLHFLFGAGTSAGAGTGTGEVPTMNSLYKECMDGLDQGALKDDLGAKCEGDLEKLLGVLYSQLHYYESVGNDEEKESISSSIKKIKDVVFEKIHVQIENDNDVLKTYKDFYTKIATRSKDLARVNIFTTNNDLFNERALDALKIDYNNGFGGGLKRTFNPARFSYTFSRKVDINLEKYEAIERMVYLYKLHGSVNWFLTGEGNMSFSVEEKNPAAIHKNEAEDRVMIYPTPAKGGLSLSGPYSDLLREFQTKLLLPHSTLIIIGCSFSDDHINGIMEQALGANASLSIVIFGNPNPEKCGWVDADDNRVYRIYGEDEEKIHYFDYIVKSLLPEADKSEEDEVIKNFRKFINRKENDQ